MALSLSVHHGTSLCIDDMPFWRPQHAASIFDASFFSTHLEVAKGFSLVDSSERLLPVVLSGEQRFDKPYIIRGDHDPYAALGIHHDDPLEMRQQLFDRLRQDHDGLIYHDQHDQPFEVVAFREDTFLPDTAIVHSGHGWSQKLDFAQLQRVFDSWKRDPAPVSPGLG